MDFVNADIHSIFRLISDVARLNIIASDEVQGRSRSSSTTCRGTRRSQPCSSRRASARSASGTSSASRRSSRSSPSSRPRWQRSRRRSSSRSPTS
jgi:hypothetical protein